MDVSNKLRLPNLVFQIWGREMNIKLIQGIEIIFHTTNKDI